MKRKNFLAMAFFATVAVVCFGFTASAQTTNEGTVANVVGGGSGIRWDVSAANNGGTLTITFPDGRSARKTFRAGVSPQLSLGEKYFDNLPDGTYTYELQLAPVISTAQREALQKARGKDDDPENERAARKRSTIPGLVQSGSFAVINGSIVIAGAAEPETARPKASTRLRQTPSLSASRSLRGHHFSLFPDVVTPDDSIIQGSECVGLDCVNNESFGFDTIRLKENNDRLQFDDTSTSAGFPNNNWQIRANDSGSGGENFLGIVDQGATGNSESGTIIFKVTAGATANSLKVASNSKVGFRTATPVLDLHMNTTDTPAVRFEQNNTGGFSAQTWDVAGNEANFFVRDVTSGSRLPFRIRPGAPTSSIDISASGNVGIGTASPGDRMVVTQSGAESAVTVNADAAQQSTVYFSSAGTKKSAIYRPANSNDLRFNIVGVGDALTMVSANGNIGIATTAPTATLSVNGTANKPGGGSWDVFSDQRLKSIRGQFTGGLQAVMRLQPLRYEYKPDNALGLKSNGEHIGFSAQAVQKIVPEAVTQNSNGYLMINNDPILWTMLNAIKEQQREIVQLRAQVKKLQSRRRRG
jgi:hypothetical protein